MLLHLTIVTLLFNLTSIRLGYQSAINYIVTDLLIIKCDNILFLKIKK
jgi:hypothetical protein